MTANYVLPGSKAVKLCAGDKESRWVSDAQGQRREKAVRRVDLDPKYAFCFLLFGSRFSVASM